MINRAGFPPINLAPVSFEALYVQQLQQQQQQQQSNGAAAAPQIVIAK
jgi:preprotein translocase subunit SecB